MKTYSQRSIKFFLILLNTLLSIYFIILAFFSRPHFDDLHFMWATRDMGSFGFVYDTYYNWSGRYVGYVIVGIIERLQYLTGNNLLFPFIFGLFGFWITYFSIKKILGFSSWLLMNIVMLFYWIYVLTVFDFAVFNWYCAMSYFIIAPVHLLFLFYINNKNVSIKTWIILFFLSLFLGAGYEGYTPIVLVSILVNMYYLLKRNNWNPTTLNDLRIKKMFYSGLLLTLFYVMLIIAPGNYVRMNALQEFHFKLSFFQYIEEYLISVMLFFYFSFFNLLYYIGVFILSAYFSFNNKEKIDIKFDVRKVFKSSLLLYLLIVFVAIFIPVYLWGNFGVYRHYIPINFITIMLIGFCGFIFGFFSKKTKLFSNKYVIAGVLLLFIINTSISIFYDSRSASKYANEVDQRITMLRIANEKGVKGKLFISPIKNVPYTNDSKYMLLKLFGLEKEKPVLYYYSDVDSVAVDYSIHLRKLYRLNFDVYKLKNDH